MEGRIRTRQPNDLTGCRVQSAAAARQYANWSKWIWYKCTERTLHVSKHFFPYNSLLCIIIYTGIWYDAILFSLLHNLLILTNYIKGTQLCHSLHVQVKYTIKIYAASIGNRKSNWNKEVNIVCMHFCHSCMLTKEPVWKMHKLQSSNQFVTSTSTCVVHWIILQKYHIPYCPSQTIRELGKANLKITAEDIKMDIHLNLLMTLNSKKYCGFVA